MSMLVLRSSEDLVPKDHRLRRVKLLPDAAIKEIPPVLDGMYAERDRASVPPEWVLKGSLLMALCSVRSGRMLCEQLTYNMLFRWFLDMDMVEQPFDHSMFSENRERLMDHDVARLFFQRVVEQARQAKLMGSECFTVDGTLLEAWASLKSFQPQRSARRSAGKRGQRHSGTGRRALHAA